MWNILARSQTSFSCSLFVRGCSWNSIPAQVILFPSPCSTFRSQFVVVCYVVVYVSAKRTANIRRMTIGSPMLAIRRAPADHDTQACCQGPTLCNIVIWLFFIMGGIMWLYFIIIITIIIIIIYKFSMHILTGVFSKVSVTASLLSSPGIPSDINSTVVWVVPILHRISNSSEPFMTFSNRSKNLG